MLTENGILLLDKPEGISSAAALNRVKRVLGAKKAGHAGTLDPFATGLLICCINKATRLARFLIHSDKTYRGRLILGIETDTHDATGTVMAEHDTGDTGHELIRDAFGAFLGWQQQHPPVYSALKHRGMPLYKLARKGRPVQKPARQIRIDSLNIIRIDMPAVDFEVSCSAGTYIRSLCADIGRRIGCGGHLGALRRTRCGHFTVDEAVTLTVVEQEPADVSLLTMTAALPDMPVVTAGRDLTRRIQHGMPPTADELPVGSEPDRRLKIVGTDDRLLAVMEFDQTQQCWRYCCVFNT